jgi:RNA polymerase sigma-70 factor, ECF subfamily
MPASTACQGDEEIQAAIRALQKGGPRDAFEPIYRRSYLSLFRFFANRPALREEAEDLTDETLFRAYQNIGQFEAGTNFDGWLLTIAVNVWKNAVRKQRAGKRAATLEPLESMVETGPDEEAVARERSDLQDQRPSPEDLALKIERTTVLREALEGLPPGMRQCMELRVFADLEYQEIADALGIGLGSVRSQLFEARQRLKPVLERYFQGAEL